jgi:Mg-chelatase subunit ChlD
LRLFGRIGLEDILASEIEQGNVLPQLDNKNLDYASVERLSQTAVDHENLPALVSLAKVNRYAVSNTLSSDKLTSLGRLAGKGGIYTPRLYFIVRGVVDTKRRKVFRRLARSSLLKMSLRVAGQGLRGDVPVRGEYYPGADFDLEETLEQALEKHVTAVPKLTSSEIIAIEKRERKKNGILMLDASGSMMGNRNINAALAAAVMAYAMRRDRYGVIAFNTRAFTIKGINEEVAVENIVDRILDLEAVGYTNIEDALKRGALELRGIKSRFKWGILLTDGSYNRGEDPRYLAREFEKLHVIGLPGKKSGERVCSELARMGGGRYVAVRRYREVPRALMKILQTPW